MRRKTRRDARAASKRRAARKSAAAPPASPAKPPSQSDAADGSPNGVPSTASRYRSPEHQARERVLFESGVTKQQIKRALADERILLSHQTIANVIGGVHRNADVERKFCELTNSTPAAMFPPKADETKAAARR